VFVARLDAAGDHFDLLNNGQPLSPPGFDSTRPDIAFAGNTPYVSWHETNSAGQTVTVVGHFEGNAVDPAFHVDAPAIPTTPQGTSDDDATDVRSPNRPRGTGCSPVILRAAYRRATAPRHTAVLGARGLGAPRHGGTPLC
jgi:hypothetical protein